MVLSPRKSGEYIASLAKNIKIQEDGIKKLGQLLVEEVKEGKLLPSNFTKTGLHPKPDDHWCLEWLFVVDTLNYCFWSTDDDPSSSWKVEGYTGYYGLCAAINRAMKENIDILNPKYYSVITEKQVKHIMRSDTNVEIPLLEQRVKCLHEVGERLLENFEGSFKNVLQAAENSAVKLLDLIVTNFKCFRDEAEYKNQKVSLYKRAQILIGDIWSCFGNNGLGYFKDIEEITMFADYRVPQTLLYFGVFQYSDELTDKLKKGEVLVNGDELEVEIRGCSIHAVELLRDYVNQHVDSFINSVLIDNFLWDFRRRNAKEILEKGIPFHKTYSIYY